MKLKRSLEFRVWRNTFIDEDEQEHEDAGESYKIDGRNVSEDVFRKERQRLCLRTKETSYSDDGHVHNGPNPAGHSSIEIITITQYFPLPFYH